jgi:hypothetical protein
MQSLQHDIIYNIFFYIDDYITLNNFWILSKDFNKQYMTRYNKSYKHKFNVLFDKLFTFLSMLPEHNFSENDLDFFELVSSQCLEQRDKKTLHKDITFTYYLYKTHLLYFFTPDCFNQYISSIANKLSNIIMLQGTKIINNITSLYFNKNTIKISRIFNTQNETLEYILKSYEINKKQTLNIQNTINILKSYETNNGGNIQNQIRLLTR